MRSVPSLLTPGRLAAELGVPIHRILHILRTRHHIQPAARAGTLRLFSRHSLDAVRDELRAQDARRGAKGGDA